MFNASIQTELEDYILYVTVIMGCSQHINVDVVRKQTNHQIKAVCTKTSFKTCFVVFSQSKDHKKVFKRMSAYPHVNWLFKH